MGSKDSLEHVDSKNKRQTRRGIGGPDLVVGIVTVVAVGVAGKLFSILKSSGKGNVQHSTSEVMDGNQRSTSLRTNTVPNEALANEERHNSLKNEKTPDGGTCNNSVDWDPTESTGDDESCTNAGNGVPTHQFLDPLLVSEQGEEKCTCNKSVDWDPTESTGDDESCTNAENGASTHQFLDPLLVSEQVKEKYISTANTLSELVNHALLDAEHDSVSTLDILNKTKSMHEEIAGVIARAFEDFGSGESSSGDELATADLKINVTWKSSNTVLDCETESESDASRDSFGGESSICATENRQRDFLETEGDEQVERINRAPATEGEPLSDCVDSPPASAGNDTIDGPSRLLLIPTNEAESETPPQPESATYSIISEPKTIPSCEEQNTEITTPCALSSGGLFRASGSTVTVGASASSESSICCGGQDFTSEIQEELVQEVSYIEVEDGTKSGLLPEVQDGDLVLSPELSDDTPGDVLNDKPDILPDEEDAKRVESEVQNDKLERLSADKQEVLLRGLEHDKPEFVTGVDDKDIEGVTLEVLKGQVETICTLADNSVTECHVSAVGKATCQDANPTSDHSVGVSVKDTTSSLLGITSGMSTDITEERELVVRRSITQRKTMTTDVMVEETLGNIKSMAPIPAVSVSKALSGQGSRCSNQDTLRERLPLEVLAVAVMIALIAIICYTFYDRFQASAQAL